MAIVVLRKELSEDFDPGDPVSRSSAPTPVGGKSCSGSGSR
ncbi:hypothetical protein ACH4VX_31195 [Streptomyces sp. NPDC020731]